MKESFRTGSAATCERVTLVLEVDAASSRRRSAARAAEDLEMIFFVIFLPAFVFFSLVVAARFEWPTFCGAAFDVDFAAVACKKV